MDEILGYIASFFIGGLVATVIVVKSIDATVDHDCDKYGMYVTDKYKLTCVRK